jgi:hypothetical protein
MWSWNENCLDQAQADTRIQGAKGTHDKNSHRLRIMHAGSSAPGVGGIQSYMSDNSDSDDSAKFQAFDFIRSKVHTALSCRSYAERKRRIMARMPLSAKSERHFGFQLQFRF